jgi:hypothetical protein
VRIDKTTVTIAGLGGGVSTTVANLSINPSVETGVGQWASGWFNPPGAGTLARVSPGYRGDYLWHKTWTVATPQDNDTGFTHIVPGIVAGRFYAFRGSVRASKNTGMTGRVLWRDAANANIGTDAWFPGFTIGANTAGITPANTWRDVTGVLQAPPGAVIARFIFGAWSYDAPGTRMDWLVGDTHDADAALCVEVPTATSPVPAYFDGDTTDTITDRYDWTGTPHGSTSTHTVVPVTDATCWVDHVTIRHGREDYGEQAEADTTTVELSPDHTGAAVPAIEIGADLLITHQVTDTGPVFTRFRGRVSDVSRTWDDVGEATPDQGLCQVVAVSSLGELGRRLVGDEPWPQELDGARALRILRLAYPTLPATNVDPGIYQLIPRDVDRQDALALVHEAAEAGGGLVWTKAGDPFPYYADFEHRRGTVAALELDACDILAAPTWSRDLSGLCNYISLTYGVAPAEGEAPSLTSRNQPSVDKFGEYGLSVTLALANQADAQARANLLTTRNGAPQWVLSELPLAVSELDPATVETLLGLDTHSLMLLTGLPAAGSAPTSAYVWIEGWAEELAAGTHELTMAVSSYCATAPPVRWNDVPPEPTWDTADPSWTWDSVVCIGPTPNHGRWDDVPATTRWDVVPATVTWDTYTGG